MADNRPDERKGMAEEESLRHKTGGHGTHGEPTKKEVNQEMPTERDLPEGNGATVKPAAFPSKP